MVAADDGPTFVPVTPSRMDATGSPVVVETERYALNRQVRDRRFLEIRRSWERGDFDEEYVVCHRIEH
jgi:hypothetical protein